MPAQIIWHGTEQEKYDFLTALAHSCECIVDGDGPQETCAAHKMLLTDQRALDGLVFMHREAQRLKEQEFRETRRDPRTS